MSEKKPINLNKDPWWGWSAEYPEDGMFLYAADTREDALEQARNDHAGPEYPEIEVLVRRVTAKDIDDLYVHIGTVEEKADRYERALRRILGWREIDRESITTLIHDIEDIARAALDPPEPKVSE